MTELPESDAEESDEEEDDDDEGGPNCCLNMESDISACIIFSNSGENSSFGEEAAEGEPPAEEAAEAWEPDIPNNEAKGFEDGDESSAFCEI